MAFSDIQKSTIQYPKITGEAIMYPANKGSSIISIIKGAAEEFFEKKPGSTNTMPEKGTVNIHMSTHIIIRLGFVKMIFLNE